MVSQNGGVFDESTLASVPTPPGTSLSGDFSDTDDGGAPADADTGGWLNTVQQVKTGRGPIYGSPDRESDAVATGTALT